MEIIENAAEDYLELFESAYQQTIYRGYVADLERAAAAAAEVAASNPARAIEADQVRVELANARERLQSSESRFRLETSRLRTNLGLQQSVEIGLEPVIEVTPVPVDADEAVRLARNLTPRLRQLEISRRQDAIQLDETRGRGGFRVDLEFTYGREMRDLIFRQLWGQPSNTYTVEVNAHVPVWDWGERRARIEAQRINVRRTELRIEQTEAEIVSDVRNEVRNVEELEARALAMEDNLRLAEDISRQSLDRYREGSITALDLLQSRRRAADTATNLLDAYVGWRESLLSLQALTYYNFELARPVLERFGVVTGTADAAEPLDPPDRP